MRSRSCPIQMPMSGQRVLRARGGGSMTATATRPVSPQVTERAVAFVAERRDGAPRRPARTSPSGRPRPIRVRGGGGPRRWLSFADPVYPGGLPRIVVPGLGPTHGVRWPLLAAVLARLPGRDAVVSDRHRSWSSQTACSTSRCSRRAGSRSGCSSARSRASPSGPGSSCAARPREAHDWTTVDTLAHAFGRGILTEPFRWAELEQLVFSPSRWERRLVASTIATIPLVERPRAASRTIVARGLEILGISSAMPNPMFRKRWPGRPRSMANRSRRATLARLRAERRAPIPTTATAPGSSATLCRRSPDGRDPELRARPGRRSDAGRGRRRRRRAASPPPGSSGRGRKSRRSRPISDPRAPARC